MNNEAYFLFYIKPCYFDIKVFLFLAYLSSFSLVLNKRLKSISFSFSSISLFQSLTSGSSENIDNQPR